MAPLDVGGLPVYLNLYDVSNAINIQLLNGIIANKNAAFKLGGVFHAGVEINGREWTFGFVSEGSGVKAKTPRTDPQHHFRETVRLPNTRLSEKEVFELLENLSREYMGSSYSLLTRNCCHFAEDLCQQLGVGSLPPWVHRLHRVGDSIRKVSSSFEHHLGVFCPQSESGQCAAQIQCANQGDVKLPLRIDQKVNEGREQVKEKFKFDIEDRDRVCGERDSGFRNI